MLVRYSYKADTPHTDSKESNKVYTVHQPYFPTDALIQSTVKALSLKLGAEGLCLSEDLISRPLYTKCIKKN